MPCGLSQVLNLEPLTLEPNLPPSLISPTLHTCIADALVDQGFGVFPEALPPTVCQALRNEALLAALAPAGVGRGKVHQHKPDVRRDAIAWIEPNTPATQAWLQGCDDLRRALNRSLMLGLQYFESHFARYGVGDFYALHRDAFAGTSNRRLSVLLYLNPDWQASHGGELVLYGSEGGEVRRVLPQQGTLVVFLSEQFPHEVLPAQRERYSIAGWFR